MQRRTFLRTSLSILGAAAFSPFALSAGPQKPAEFTRRVLYVLAQFSQATPESMRKVVETIGGSGFNVVILSFLQAAWNNGKLILLYNGNDFSRLSPELPQLFVRLRSGFPVAKRLMLSIGGWQQVATFAAIRNCGVSQFVRQLTDQVIGPLGLDGIDIDLEPQTGGMDQWINIHREYGKVLVDLTNEYKRIHPEHLVTHAPPSGVAAELYAKAIPLKGLSSGLLAATRNLHGNNVDWVNVQFYEGGLVQNGDIAGFYCDSLVQPMETMRAQTGIANPLHFLLPLFQPQANQALVFCTRAIQAIDRRCADLHFGSLNGVALWEYRQVASAIGEWSHGLETAMRA